MKSTRSTTSLLAFGVAVLVVSPSVSGEQFPFPRATARIYSCSDPNVLVGTATLYEYPSSEGVKDVAVWLAVRNLTVTQGTIEGKHAVHIHAVGACTPCSAAGSHLDLNRAIDSTTGQIVLSPNNIPVTLNHPYHSGDLINVRADANGSGVMTHVTSRVALSAGNLSIFDADGASVVIHNLPDTYCEDPTDPNCAGGGRAACGILHRIQ